MKTVPCSYENCNNRRVHWSKPDEPRERQLVSVPSDHEGPAYCSIECATYAGALKPKPEPKAD